MALVVGDIEAEKLFLCFFFFVVEQGEDEATIGVAVVGFPVLVAAIDKGLHLYFCACGHGEVDALTYGIVACAEGAGKGKDRKHVVVAVI